MKSLQVLVEMFMPEARFPDEKFWDKNGDPIHPEPKGPPKGTVGRTHADIGAGPTDGQWAEVDAANGLGNDGELDPEDIPQELRGHKLTEIDLDTLKKFAPDSYDPLHMDPNSEDYDPNEELLWDHTAKKPVIFSNGKYWIWHGNPGDDFHDWVEAK